MGLDMYLNKFPRYKNLNAQQIEMVDSYFDWIEEKEKDSVYGNCTFKEWAGHDITELPSMDAMKFLRQFYTRKYDDWDKEHKYGHVQLHEQAGYWRKANAIHDWFVKHVQDGEDDCRYHQEVTKGVLEDLLFVCEKVLANCELVDGKIQNGITYHNGEEEIHYIDGQYVKDTNIAEALLPTAGGFFFGNTDYDEYYIRSIENTIDIITRVLETTDFEKEMLYYVSSW